MKRAILLIGFITMTMLLPVTLIAQEAVKSDATRVMPRLPGCEHLKDIELSSCQQKFLINYMNENLTYPISAIRQGIEGRVILKATIDNTGVVSTTEFIRPLFPACDKEAERLVLSIPNWLPAERMGVPVEETITVAVLFRLEDHYQKFPEHRPRFLPQTMDKSTRKKRRQKRMIKAQ